MPYTIKDLLVLRNMLPDNPYGLDVTALLAFDKMLDDLRKTLQRVSNSEEIATKKFSRWLSEYLMFDAPNNIKSRVAWFLQEPLEEVPLYINDKVISFFAQWRLRIGK